MDRIWKPSWAILLALGLLAAGCGEDTEKDGAVPPDTSTDLPEPDLTPDIRPGTDMKLETNFGEGCTGSSDCKPGSPVCLTISRSLGTSTCSKYCTVDDRSTPLVNEDDCPTGLICAQLSMSSGGTKNFCLKLCTPSSTKNPCPASSKTTCSPYSSRYGGINQAVCFYAACTTDKDCPVWGDTTCTANLECSKYGSNAYCNDGNCAVPGKCDTTSGLCTTHVGVGKKTAKIGDPCDSDLDCAEDGRCIKASSQHPYIGTLFPGGYCSKRGCMFGKEITEYACPSGSTCNLLWYGGYCFKTCSMKTASDCRGQTMDKGGDYECYDWTNWTSGGVKYVDQSICYETARQRCSSINSSAGCASLGDSKNTTNMICRDRYTGAKKANPKDPFGVCLDNTASGTFRTTAPDGGYPSYDSGVDASGTKD
jgi:hypothetical protein